jgi:hypothetical protein
MQRPRGGYEWQVAPTITTHNPGCGPLTFISTSTMTVGTSPPPKPKTAIDWLRERVNEVCDAAFRDIPAPA